MLHCCRRHQSNICPKTSGKKHHKALSQHHHPKCFSYSDRHSVNTISSLFSCTAHSSFVDELIYNLTLHGWTPDQLIFLNGSFIKTEAERKKFLNASCTQLSIHQRETKIVIPQKITNVSLISNFIAIHIIINSYHTLCTFPQRHYRLASYKGDNCIVDHTRVSQ